MSSNSLICAHDNIFNKSILGDDAFYFKNEKNITTLINQKEKNQENKFIKSNLNKINNLYLWDKIINEYECFFKQIISKKI